MFVFKLAVHFDLLRAGDFAAFCIHPNIRASAGALERAHGEIQEHRLARGEIGE